MGRVPSPRDLTWRCFLITGAAQWASSNPTCNAADAGERGAGPSLGGEDPLEEGTATHPRSLAWRIPWTEEPAALQSTRLRRVRQD